MQLRKKNIWKFLKDYFFEEYKELKKLFLVSLSIIVLTGIISGVFDIQIESINLAIEAIRELASTIKTQGYFSIAMLIFLNNLKTSVIITILGFTIVLPIFINVSNGFIIGTVLRQKIEETGNYFIGLKILPHGIFEIPAICISTALGLKWGFGLFYKESFSKKIERLKKTLITFIVFVIPLLLVAALIEAAFF
ncbi:stage II sporulation protein M [Candidatus Woesearchaeota archaeon]|nr:stage II sporulation protein M [Candidatus Woesearchaeota archaeon]